MRKPPVVTATRTNSAACPARVGDHRWPSPVYGDTPQTAHEPAALDIWETSGARPCISLLGLGLWATGDIATGRRTLRATITLDEAVAKLKQPKRGRSGSRSAAIADPGAHPTSGLSIQVKTGRFGPYVTDGTVNATIPKGTDQGRSPSSRPSSSSPTERRNYALRARTREQRSHDARNVRTSRR